MEAAVTHIETAPKAVLPVNSIARLSFAPNRNAKCFAAGRQHLVSQPAISDGARDDNRADQ